jgi:elongation factor P
MKINANSIRMGNVLEHKNRLWMVMKQPDHTMPGKGGAFIQVEMRDIKSGTKLNERFRSTENVEKVRLDQKQYQYLYMEGDNMALMDNESFEQILIDKNILGDKLNFLQDNMLVTLETYQDDPISMLLPETVILEVSEAEPVVKGQTAAASYKPAILENGVRIMVPPFVVIGDKVVVRTEDASYLERAKV